MEKIIGIDLGTTNSVVAVLEDGKPRVIKEKGSNQSIIPSVVGFTPSKELVVGFPALNQYAMHPENTVRSIKRQMGSTEKIKMGNQEYSPPEISAMILRHMKRIAEEDLGTEVRKAVITVPAYFSDAQRQATKDAGQIAGLEVVRIINEPTAAALAYGIDKDEDMHVLVYDLGGGTFDVSVIEHSQGVTEVRASHGNTQLGGDDFDALLVKYLLDEFAKENKKIDLTKDRKAMARLTNAAEAAKIELSRQAFTKVNEPGIARSFGVIAKHLEVEISRAQFEEMIESLLKSTLESIDKALEDAQIKSDQLDKILLVGGSTRIPMVWELLHKHLGKAPHSDINPDEAVALGAAVQAGIIAGEEIHTVLVDVCPYSLGVEHVDIRAGRLIPNLYKRLIKRNTTIPTSTSEAFYTLHPDQDSVHIKVYQGDYPVASMNRFLGEFVFEGLSPAKEKDQCREVVINFDYDVDGIVHVSAVDRMSGKKEGITITQNQLHLSEQEKQEAQQRLAATQETTAAPVLAGKDEFCKRVQAFQKHLQESNVDQAVQDKTADLLAQLTKASEQGEVDKIKERLLELMYDHDFAERCVGEEEK